MQFSRRIMPLQETIRKISDAARNIPGCARFDIGQPDFRTPEHIREAAIKSIRDKQVGYTQTSGIPELRQAIADYENKKGIDIKAENVMVSNGGTGALFSAFLGILEENDEAILPDPSWSPYELIIRSVGGVPVYAQFFEGKKLLPESIENAITPKTKAIVVNSPENPTGRVASKKDLETIAEIANDRQIAIISDEVYDKLVFDDAKHFSIAKFAPENTILVNSVSKTYSMTGWRLGWIVAPEQTVKECTKCNRATTASPNAVSQYAALAALEGDQKCVEEMRNEYEKRRNIIIKRIKGLGWKLTDPEGAFYAFPEVGGDSWNFSMELLQRAKVAVVPGASFGPSGEGHVRFCFGSANTAQISAGFERIANFIGQSTH